MLGGCVTSPSNSNNTTDGPPTGYVDTSSISDAVPKPHYGHLKHTPYELGGKAYTPMKSAHGYVQDGTASWYGVKFHGKQTANGEVYDMYKMTAAHKTLPLPSYVKVTNLENNRSVILRVNDRGPFHDDRLIDVSYVAAKKLGFANNGTSQVKIEGIDPHAFPGKKGRSNTADENNSLVYLQLAALENYHSAQLLRRDIYRKLGVTAHVVNNQNDEDSYYRIRVGPVESPEQMEELLENLADARFPVPYVVYE